MRKAGKKLSAREGEVLRLAARGDTSAQVAAALFISPRTIDFHLANLYAKLGAGNRLQAINAARAAGLLP